MSEVIEFEAIADPRDIHSVATSAVMRSGSPLVRQLTSFSALALIIAGPALLMLVTTGPIGQRATDFWFWGLVNGMVAWIAYGFVQQKFIVGGYIAALRKDGEARGSSRVRITPDGIEMASRIGEGTLNWLAIREVRTYPKGIALITNGLGVILIPDSALPPGRNSAETISLIESWRIW